MSGRQTGIAAVQIAGVRDRAEVEILARAGVEWIGIPLRLDVNSEDVTDADARKLVAECRCLNVTFVLITYLRRAADILSLTRFLGVTHVQLHGAIQPDDIMAVRAGMPGACIIKSLVIRADNEPALRHDVRMLAAHVDAFITDTFDTRTGASGATGRIHDWNVSRRLVELSPKPIILAGGLSAENVADAIATVRPAGVDAHTGVEGADGRKDADKVARFVEAARNAFEQIKTTQGRLPE